MRRTILVTVAVVGLLAGFVPVAEASHLYRGPASGCTSTSGDIGDAVEPAATVMLGSYSYHDPGTALLPVTVVQEGDAVRWTWNSPYCHSVTGPGGTFNSGLRYPTAEPTTPKINNTHYLPETEPGLSFTATFNTPGTFLYSCVHHAGQGMRGIVVVV